MVRRHVGRWVVGSLVLAGLVAACSQVEEASEPADTPFADEAPTTTAIAETTGTSETTTPAESRSELELRWSLLALPASSAPPEVLFASTAVDADDTAVFAVRSGAVWRSTDLQTFSEVSDDHLGLTLSLDANLGTVVGTDTDLRRPACAYQGEGAQIALSNDLGDTWSFIETPVPQANLEHPDRLWRRHVEATTDGRAVLVVLFQRTYASFLSYADCLVPTLGDGWVSEGMTADGIVINTGDEVRKFGFDELDLTEDDLTLLTGAVVPDPPDHQFWLYDIENGGWTETSGATGVVRQRDDFVSTAREPIRSSDGFTWSGFDLPDGVVMAFVTKTALVGPARETSWISLDAGRSWEAIASPIEQHRATDAVEFAGTTFYLFQQDSYRGQKVLGYRDTMGEWQLTDLEQVADLGVVGDVSFLGVVDGALVISVDSDANSLLVLHARAAT